MSNTMNLRDNAREAMSSGADRIKDAASAVGEKARGMATTVAETAQSLAKKPDEATAAVGGGLKNVAESIREHAPASGMLHNASSAVADSLEHGGQYLQEKGVTGIGQDLTNLIRRNPLPALVLGIGIGFLIARAIRS